MNTVNQTAYDTDYLKQAAQLKKTNFWHAFIEVILLGVAIVFGLSYLQIKDEAARRELARADLVAKCQLEQYNVIHEYDCKIINKHLAKLIID
jgi:hypothetical protein